MQLYTEQDFMKTKKAFRLRVIILGVILAVTFTLMGIFVTVARNQIAVIATTAVGFLLAYGYLMIKLTPWFRYYRYQMDIRSGRSRETDAWFVSCSDGRKLSDGVEFHEMIVRVGDGEDDERLFYWDADKARPQLTEGQKVHIRSYGNYVLELDAQ